MASVDKNSNNINNINSSDYNSINTNSRHTTICRIKLRSYIVVNELVQEVKFHNSSITVMLNGRPNVFHFDGCYRLISANNSNVSCNDISYGTSNSYSNSSANNCSVGVVGTTVMNSNNSKNSGTVINSTTSINEETVVFGNAEEMLVELSNVVELITFGFNTTILLYDCSTLFSPLRNCYGNSNSNSAIGSNTGVTDIELTNFCDGYEGYLVNNVLQQLYEKLNSRIDTIAENTVTITLSCYELVDTQIRDLLDKCYDTNCSIFGNSNTNTINKSYRVRERSDHTVFVEGLVTVTVNSYLEFSTILEDALSRRLWLVKSMISSANGTGSTSNSSSTVVGVVGNVFVNVSITQSIDTSSTDKLHVGTSNNNNSNSATTIVKDSNRTKSTVNSSTITSTSTMEIVSLASTETLSYKNTKFETFSFLTAKDLRNEKVLLAINSNNNDTTENLVSKRNQLQNSLKSLTTLRRIVQILKEKSDRVEESAETNSDANSKHVPYRDSILTRLLQKSLEGNSFMVMISSVNERSESITRTLRFASEIGRLYNHLTVDDKYTNALYQVQLKKTKTTVTTTNIINSKKPALEVVADTDVDAGAYSKLNKFSSLFGELSGGLDSVIEQLEQIELAQNLSMQRLGLQIMQLPLQHKTESINVRGVNVETENVIDIDNSQNLRSDSSSIINEFHANEIHDIKSNDLLDSKSNIYAVDMHQSSSDFNNAANAKALDASDKGVSDISNFVKDNPDQFTNNNVPKEGEDNPQSQGKAEKASMIISTLPLAHPFPGKSYNFTLKQTESVASTSTSVNSSPLNGKGIGGKNLLPSVHTKIAYKDTLKPVVNSPAKRNSTSRSRKSEGTTGAKTDRIASDDKITAESGSKGSVNEHLDRKYPVVTSVIRLGTGSVAPQSDSNTGNRSGNISGQSISSDFQILNDQGNEAYTTPNSTDLHHTETTPQRSGPLAKSMQDFVVGILESPTTSSVKEKIKHVEFINEQAMQKVIAFPSIGINTNDHSLSSSYTGELIRIEGNNGITNNNSNGVQSSKLQINRTISPISVDSGSTSAFFQTNNIIKTKMPKITNSKSYTDLKTNNQKTIVHEDVLPIAVEVKLRNNSRGIKFGLEGDDDDSDDNLTDLERKFLRHVTTGQVSHAQRCILKEGVNIHVKNNFERLLYTYYILLFSNVFFIP